jgi:hypothetical protein
MSTLPLNQWRDNGKLLGSDRVVSNQGSFNTLTVQTIVNANHARCSTRATSSTTALASVSNSTAFVIPCVAAQDVVTENFTLNTATGALTFTGPDVATVQVSLFVNAIPSTSTPTAFTLTVLGRTLKQYLTNMQHSNISSTWSVTLAPGDVIEPHYTAPDSALTIDYALDIVPFV